MGTAHYGKLIYGYHFGAEESLLLREAQKSDTNEDGYLITSWYNYRTTMDENYEKVEGALDPLEAMTKRLYDSIADAEPAEYDWQRDEIVKQHLGVWFESHCTVDYPMWVLTTREIYVSYGDVQAVDPAVLTRDPQDNGWDAKLEHALKVLDVTPLQESPAWLLCTDRG